MVRDRYQPFPWLSVILASFPGLLVALSRRHAVLLGPLLSILGYAYLGVLVLALPVIWWKRRRFPVWALLPAGTFIWFLTYIAGTQLSQRVRSLYVLDLQWTGIETGIGLIHLVLAVALFTALLRRRRMPASFWLVMGVILFGNLLVAALYGLAGRGGARLFPGMLRYFIAFGGGPVEGLMLVAVGLLAARQHGVLAILVVVGGYGYMCFDSDYLLGFRLREWTGLSAYLVAVTLTYLVAVPLALLRARTRLARALAVFVPVVAFHVARLAIPMLVISLPLGMPTGDILLSINVLLSLVLAWVLYTHVGEPSPDAQPDASLEPAPAPPGLMNLEDLSS